LADAAWIPPGYPTTFASSRQMDDPVCLAMIRLWCEVLEDKNPVYYDEAVARANGFDGIIAPPPMIMAWMNRAEWTPAGPVPSFSEGLKGDSADYPHGAGLMSVQNHSRPLIVGERLMVHQFLSELSEASDSPRGFGCRQRRYVGLRDQRGDEISNIEFTTLRMKTAAPHEPPLPPMPHFAGSEADPAHAEVGQVLPGLEMLISYKRCIKWVAASRDYYEVHLDPNYARQTGAKDLYIGVHFFQGLVGRFITDWTGPRGFLRRMEFAQGGRCFPGETATVVGRVVSVRQENATTVVELDIVVGCDRGRVYDARATVSLAQVHRGA